MRSVLSPIDFSPRARLAARWAGGLAARLGAKLVILHVLPPPAFARLAVDAYLQRPMPHPEPEAERATVDRMEAFVEGLFEREPALVVEYGIPAATIVRIAVELPAELVVIGTNGQSHLWHRSVALTVMTCSPCPVITLRGDERGWPEHDHRC
jgi:nucleotide-binding universal stress UspA family protein